VPVRMLAFPTMEMDAMSHVDTYFAGDGMHIMGRSVASLT
jgi:hypothetical protein